NEAVIEPETAALTVLVVTVNDTLLAPAGTVTLAGTDAAALVLASATAVPPAGPGPFRAPAPRDGLPPAPVVGSSARRPGTGPTGGVAAGCPPPKAGVIVTGMELVTVLVVMVKVALLLPAKTVTLAGTPATAVLLLESATLAPPASALPLSVTVPVDGFPPTTVAGLRLTPLAWSGTTVRVADFWTPPNVAVIEAGVGAVPGLVLIVNVAVVAPPATVTLDGTVATALLLDSGTAAPPGSAALVSVTVPVDGFPPATVGGFRVTLPTVGGGWTIIVTGAEWLRLPLDPVIVSE